MNVSLKNNLQSGYLLVLVLVFGAIFLTILMGFISFIYSQSRVVTQRVQLEQAGNIAEAGLNYYRWFLAHYPDDVTNGTGAPGPYVEVYTDPAGNAIGEYSLDIESTEFCGDVSTITVHSTGYTYENPSVKRTISASYRRPTVADYSFIINQNVWAGDSRVITGPYHSNGGIRMDGQNNSQVTSMLGTWTCTDSFGCSPATTKPGVFSTESHSRPELFSYPVPQINFGNFKYDLLSMKEKAINNGGLFLPASNKEGYEITINGDDIEVYRVVKTHSYYGLSVNDLKNYQLEDNVIKNKNVVPNKDFDPSCPIIFVEDRVWLKGNLNDRVTLIASNQSDTSKKPSIILQGNITYNNPDAGLLALAESNVLIGVNVPNNLYLNGIFIAKEGYYGRNHYTASHLSSIGMSAYVFRNSENLNGTVVSNGQVGTQWTSSGVPVSGFYNRYNTFDRNLAENPPALTPRISEVYQFLDWRDAR